MKITENEYVLWLTHDYQDDVHIHTVYPHKNDKGDWDSAGHNLDVECGSSKLSSMLGLTKHDKRGIIKLNVKHSEEVVKISANEALKEIADLLLREDLSAGLTRARARAIIERTNIK